MRSPCPTTLEGSAVNALPRWLWRDALLPMAASRLALFAVAVIALHAIAPPAWLDAWEIGPDDRPRKLAPGDPLYRGNFIANIYSRWDGGWYGGIIREGYSYSPDAQSNVGFFPLYPMLVRYIHQATLRPDTAGARFRTAAAVSLLCSLLAAGYLVALFRMDADEDTAARAGLYLSVYPATVYMGAVYTEGLFLWVIVAAFYHARRGQWAAAALFACAAGATRIPGVLLAAPLLWEYMKARGFQWRRIRPDILWFGLMPLGFLGYAGFLWWQFGSPTIFATQHEHHDRFVGPLWNAFVRFFEWERKVIGAEPSWMDFWWACFAVGMVAAAWRWLRFSYALHATLMVAVPLSSGSVAAMSRYLIPAFPMFLLLAMAGRNRCFDRAWLPLSAFLAGLMMALFACWHDVG